MSINDDDFYVIMHTDASFCRIERHSSYELFKQSFPCGSPRSRVIKPGLLMWRSLEETMPVNVAASVLLKQSSLSAHSGRLPFVEAVHGPVVFTGEKMIGVSASDFDLAPVSLENEALVGVYCSFAIEQIQKVTFDEAN